MAEDNITVAVFSDGGRETTAAPLWQYDYGQILQLAGIPELPVAYEVQFSNDREKGSAKTQIGGEDGVAIPDEFLVTGKPVFAWVFLHAGEEDGETVYQVTIPVRRRSRATDAPPTPQQQSAITEAIAALNAAVEQTAEDAAAAAQSEHNAAASEEAAAASERNAASSERNAASSERNAAQSASNAHTSEVNAGDSASAAAGSANEAEGYAEQAAQYAAQAGYMYFYIDDDGHLIYQHTPNVQVDFYLLNGHLYVGDKT